MSINEKSEKRFNFIDILIILAVLIIAVSIIFRAQLITFFSDGERRSECTIEFQCENVPNESLAFISSGSSLSWLEHEVVIGTLENTEVSPATAYILRNDGSYDKVSDPKNSFIKGTLSADVLYNNGCYIGGTAFLAPGMTITVYSENVQFEMTILKITY